MGNMCLPGKLQRRVVIKFLPMKGLINLGLRLLQKGFIGLRNFGWILKVNQETMSAYVKVLSD